MGIYDSCSSTCLWEGYLLDFALRTVIKKNYILVYMEKKMFWLYALYWWKKFCKGSV